MVWLRWRAVPPGLPELEAWAAAQPALVSAGGCLSSPLLTEQPLAAAEEAAAASASAQPVQVVVSGPPDLPTAAALL